MNSIELFAGAGGLALGASLAGFKHSAVIEWDKCACDTIRYNQDLRTDYVTAWPLVEADARNFNYAPFAEKIDLIAGGPPCQPFSLAGKHRGYLDKRDMFPEAVRAVRELQPRAFIIENVKGITRPAFFNYLQYICLCLEFPEERMSRDEEWFEHLERLQRIKTKGRYDGLRYNLVKQLVNAADYGVPQKRERVFIVGFRADQGIDWTFPTPTHGQDTLLHEQWVTGDYWDRYKIPKPKRPKPSYSLLKRLDRIRYDFIRPSLLPWRSVRDAISDLPTPNLSNEMVSTVANHLFQPGAKAYPGHTGSPLDEPAKTLKAGDHGVPGGENMLVLPDGGVRYFTVRESARLQTFPDEYVFNGSWSKTMRQLGNAVPVLLAKTIAESVAAKLREKCGPTKSRRPH